MKRAIVGLALVLAVTGACGGGGGKSDDANASSATTTKAAATDATIPVAQLTLRASQITDLLVAKKFEEVTRNFNATLASSFDSASLKTAWDSIVSTIGPYKSRSATGIVQGVFETPMVFGSTHMKSRITFDASGKVSQLLIVKA